MAAYNLEDNIREKLENRKIQPAAESWKKLQAQLDSQQPAKKSYLWYYVAASLVSFLIISSVFWNDANTVKEKVVDVEVKNKNILPKSNKDAFYINSSKDAIASEEKKPKQNDKNEQVADVQPSAGEKVNIVKQELVTSEVNLNPKSSLDVNAYFQQKVDEVVASVTALQKTNNEVSEEEIENLLLRAERQIIYKDPINASQPDAMALLEEVEWELEKSFRDKVFDALGDGFKKIRTAISQKTDW